MGTQDLSQESTVLPAAIDRRKKIRRTIAVNAQLSAPFIIMNALATTVAAYGLLTNSTAVVIGAMIIAMLMGPIIGLALAMVDGDTRLLRNAITAEVVGAAMVTAIGFALGAIHRDFEITPEILARTQPNLLDMFIAIAGGAAGAYATLSPRVSAGLVGVAISTALVPPLASCGICLSRGLYPQAGGAFLLFATNLIAIQCASSVVLYCFGFHRITERSEEDNGNFAKRLAIDALIFLLLAIFLSKQLISTVENQQFEQGIKVNLERQLRTIPGAYLTDVRYVESGGKTIVVAVVSTPNSITPEQTAILESRIGDTGRRRVELHVRSLLTKETTAEGYLHEISPQAEPIERIVTDPSSAEGTNSSTLPAPVNGRSSEPPIVEPTGE